MRFFRRKKHPLVKIVEIMRAEQELMFVDVESQIEITLRNLPPEEALKIIAILKGETK
jgi:hypothetical protein